MSNFKIFTTIKKTLLLLVALITATIAFAKTEINGIYYNLNNSNQTAEVTYQYQYREDNYSGVTSITIPEKVTYNSTEYSVTSIGDMAFLYCSSLTSISIPNSVTSIRDYAFSYCSSLTSISIPNGVTSIGYGAFFYCDNLTSITIPNSVTSIGDDAFSGCSSLTSIDVEANNQNYASIDGVLYNKEITTLICCPGGKTSISIPNSVTSIGFYAFYFCKSLTSISIPNSVTSIGSWAFRACSSLTSITIPNSVTSIGDEAFQHCSSLTSITCLGSTPPSATDLRAQYETCILFVPKGSLNDYQNHAEWGKFLNIQELKGENPTDLETSKISSANIYTTNGTLHIEGATDDYHILDAAGRLIYSGNATTLTLPRGIYLITIGGEVEKIAL